MRQKLNEKYQLDRNKRNIVKHKNLLSHIKMGKNILTFSDIEIERNNFYRHEGPIF